MHRIDPSRLELAREFKHNPTGIVLSPKRPRLADDSHHTLRDPSCLRPSKEKH